MRIVDKLSGVKVLILGDVMQDIYWNGHVSRLNPEEPGAPCLNVDSKRRCLGGAANVASNVAALGGKAAVIGVVGEDEYGRKLADVAKAAGIHPLIVRQAERYTIRKIRLMAGDRQICRADFEKTGDFPSEVQDKIVEHIHNNVAWSDVVILEDYAKGTITERTSAALMAVARKFNKFVLVDPYPPNIQDWKLYDGGTAICPNLREMSERNKAPDKFMKHSSFMAVARTEGGDGATLFQKYAETVRFKPIFVKVHDVAGCGDTFAAVFAMCQAALGSLRQAAFIANVAAGVVAGKAGTASVSPGELHDALVQMGREAVGVLQD